LYPTQCICINLDYFMQMHLEHEPEKKSGHRLPAVSQLERFRAKASPALDAKGQLERQVPAVVLDNGEL